MKIFFAFILLLITFTFSISGCVTFDSSTKEDKEAQMRSSLSEDIIQVKQEVDSLKGQIDELQYKIDKMSHSQSQQETELNSTLRNWKTESQNDIEKRVAQLDRKIQALENKQAQDKTELQNKTNIIVEEVSKENKELRREIESIRRTPAQTSAKSPKTLNKIVSSQEGYYTVAPGDTLMKIAQSFGIPIKTLMEANSISDPNSIQVGQKILIPSE
jgi:LysM repeat protein